MKLFQILMMGSVAIWAGCSGDDMKKVETLESLRVLGLIATPPNVAPGAAYTITPIVSDAKGGGRLLYYSAEACGEGSYSGSAPTCIGRSDRVIIAQDQAVTGLAEPNYTGAATTLANASLMVVPSSYLAGKSFFLQMIGANYVFIYSIRSSDNSANITSFKKIVVSTLSPPNSNPAVSDILAKGASMARLPVGTANLRVVYPSSSEESILIPQPDGTVKSSTEDLIMSWFATDGSFDSTQTVGQNEVNYTPPSPAPSSRPVSIVVVVRDTRGGTAFMKKDVY